MQQGLAEITASGYLSGVATLHLESQDDATAIPTAVTIFNQYSQKHYPITISSAYTPIAAAIAPLANDTKTLFISVGSGGTGTDDPDYFFRMNDAVGPTKTLAKYLVVQKKAQRIGAIIDGDNAAFPTIGKNVVAGLKDAGVNDFAVSLKISTKDTDFTSILTNLRQAKVDAVVILATPGQAGNILRQMKQFGGFESVAKAGHIGWGKQVADIGGDATTGAIFPLAWVLGTPGSDKFTADYKTKFKDDPTAYSALGHDTAWLLAVAVKKVRAANKKVDGTALKDVLPDAASSKDFLAHALVAGFTLPASGASSYPGVLATFAADGSVVAVK